MKYIIVIVSIFISNCAFSRAMNVKGWDTDYIYQAVVIPKNDSVLKYMTFNLFDNNLSNVIALNIDYFVETETPVFRIYFKNQYVINKITILNGYQKNRELFYNNSRASNLIVSFFNSKNSDKYKIEFKTNTVLLDSTDKHEFLLNQDINADMILFNVQSVYPGKKSQDICISEIEFWNGDQKYQIANLEEAKKEFIVKYREKRENDVIALLATACSIEFIESKKAILDRWKKLGIPVDRVGIRRINGIETSYLEFTGKKGDFGGAMRIVGKSGNMRRGRDGEWFYLTDYIELGRWKVDEGGIIWIKVGNGEWKRNTGIFFEGTDIGKLAKIFPEG